MDVTLVTAGFEGGPRNENIDGVEIFRVGGKYSVYRKARQFYEDTRTRYDVVIDEINTRPFMTPRFVNKGECLFALIHQLAREFWFYETRWPLNWVGYYWLENHWLSQYKNVPTLTVSNSTADDLGKLGFKEIMIIPEGVDFEPFQSVPIKEEKPTLIFVGRFKRAKLPDHAFKAYRIARNEIKDLQIWMIGDGYMRRQIEKMSDENSTFFGHLPRQRRIELVSMSHLILVPAVREGWGLVVTEANAVGTPALGYDVPGLRDSIKNGRTGVLCEPNPNAMARGILSLFNNKKLDYYSEEALKDSRQYNWDRSAEYLLTLLRRCER